MGALKQQKETLPGCSTMISKLPAVKNQQSFKLKPLWVTGPVVEKSIKS